jgi:hypothetical protein
MESEDLSRLAKLIKQKNLIENEIASIIQRPAQVGHAGEFIASQIFDIQLMESAAHKAIDGYFRSGPLMGKSVNIKWYGYQEGLLDITPGALPDFYLVLTGPKKTADSSRGGTRPWVIHHIYLFDANELVTSSQFRGTKIGTATSVPKEYWNNAEIYPNSQCGVLTITPEQIKQLDWFR